MPLFKKESSKAIMTRTKLRNIFLQKRSEENRIRYTKQRNFFVSLLRKTKKRYYENLNEKSVVDNKLFWKTVKPLLSDKVWNIESTQASFQFKKKCKDNVNFNFIEVNQKQIEKEFLKLDVNKASKSSDIPIKVLK